MLRCKQKVLAAMSEQCIVGSNVSWFEASAINNNHVMKDIIMLRISDELPYDLKLIYLWYYDSFKFLNA